MTNHQMPPAAVPDRGRLVEPRLRPHKLPHADEKVNLHGPSQELRRYQTCSMRRSLKARAMSSYWICSVPSKISWVPRGCLGSVVGHDWVLCFQRFRLFGSGPWYRVWPGCREGT